VCDAEAIFRRVADGLSSSKDGVPEPPYSKERSQFRALLLSNPNYFGNLKVSPFPPVVNVASNTTWEEIGCVGFQPELSRLEAVVFINQPSGYGGDVCTPGTPEYVRFYICFDNGATWQDQGTEYFTAWNIPEGTTGAKRLEYAVTRPIQPPKKFCFFSNQALVRAILSWNVPPPPNDPNFTPVFGDVHDTHIQIEGWKIIILADALKELQVQLPKPLEKALDLTHPIPVAKSKALSVAELQKLYRGKNVQPHRYALAEMHKLISQPGQTESLMAPGSEGVFGKLDIKLSDIVSKLYPPEGDTFYEELVCVGLNNSQSALVGVIRVKESSGYSGDPCTDGSLEYVTFWGDFNDNGTFETCLGTASVRVYDIENIPSDGLEYSVYLPVDLTKYHQPCEQGAKVVKIRATLSWNVPPPCSNPSYVPVWGNREETLVHITGPVLEPGDFSPYLYEVNGVDVCSIDPSTGYATGDRPFGNVVYVMGEIPAALALTVPNTLKYKVTVNPLDTPGGPQPLANSFDIAVVQGFGPGPAVSFPMVQSVDMFGYYTYREYGTPVSAGFEPEPAAGRVDHERADDGTLGDQDRGPRHADEPDVRCRDHPLPARRNAAAKRHRAAGRDRADGRPGRHRLLRGSGPGPARRRVRNVHQGRHPARDLQRHRRALRQPQSDDPARRPGERRLRRAVFACLRTPRLRADHGRILETLDARHDADGSVRLCDPAVDAGSDDRRLRQRIGRRMVRGPLQRGLQRLLP